MYDLWDDAGPAGRVAGVGAGGRGSASLSLPPPPAVTVCSPEEERKGEKIYLYTHLKQQPIW